MEDMIEQKPDSDDTGGRTLDAIRYGTDTDRPSKKYVPEGYDSVEDFLQDVRTTYQDDLDADEENRKEALEDKEFTAGEHWDPVVKESRRGLPCLTLNTVPQFTAQLVGDWRQSRNAVKVVPGEDGDVEIASIRSGLIRNIEYKSRAERVYNDAFESCVQCGDGAFRISVEYAHGDVFDQDIFIRPVDDALSVVWDRMSVDPTGRDARHCFVDDVIPKNEFEKKWPQASPSELSENATRTMKMSGWLAEDKSVRVTEFWRMIERDRLLGLFQDGSIIPLEQENLETILEQHGMPVRTRVAPCLYAQMHLVTGWDILAGPYEYKLDRLPIIRMMGRVVNVRGKRYRFGLVRFMKDAVRLRNFWRSIAAEQLGYSPKAQWIAPQSAVEGREDKFRESHLSRDPLLIYNDDAEAPPVRVEPPAPQMALLNEAQVNTQDIKDVTGIHDASLGIKSNETSGRAIMARQREGDTAAITYYDNGNAAILEAGDVINQLISQIYDGTRIIRIVGEDEATKLVKINDSFDPESPNLGIGKYDTVLTSGVSYTTRRAEAAEAMMNAVQVWPNLIGVAGDIIAKAQDWPGAEKLAERLKKTIPPQFLDPDEQQEAGMPVVTPEMMMQMQTQLQELAAENEKLKQQYDIAWYNAETQRIRALSDHEVDATQLEQDAIAKILDVSIAKENQTSEVKPSSSEDKSA